MAALSLDESSQFYGCSPLPPGASDVARIIAVALKPFADLSRIAQTVDFPSIALVPKWVAYLSSQLEDAKKLALLNNDSARCAVISKLIDSVTVRFSDVFDVFGPVMRAAALSGMYDLSKAPVAINESNEWHCDCEQKRRGKTQLRE
jgi:hypothetical protein